MEFVYFLLRKYKSMRKTKLVYLYVGIVLFIFYSCRSSKNKPDQSSSSMNIIQDSSKLANYINLSIYKPMQVYFQYKIINASSNRDLISGPSDSILEAVIYFDSITMQEIKNKSIESKENIQKNSYQFNWLSEELNLEINKSDIKEYQPNIFVKSPLLNGGYIILNKCIILKLYTL
jgi:hypothetical protein